MIPDIYPKSRMASEHSGKRAENRNNIPGHVKNVKKQWVASREEKLQNTESWLALPGGKKIWRQDGGKEHNTRKTLPYPGASKLTKIFK